MTSKKNLQATNLQFTFEGNHQIQTVIINNEPYFVAKDVCKVLGISNSRDAMNRLDDDEKLQSVIPTLGQNRKVNIVNESGLYALIFQSRKPNAKQFRKWVTADVLPTLRKTGKYETPKTEPKQLAASNKYQKQKIDTYVSLDEKVLLEQACAKLGYASTYQLLQQLIYNFLDGNTPLHEIKQLKDDIKYLEKDRKWWKESSEFWMKNSSDLVSNLRYMMDWVTLEQEKCSAAANEVCDTLLSPKNQVELLQLKIEALEALVKTWKDNYYSYVALSKENFLLLKQMYQSK